MTDIINPRDALRKVRLQEPAWERTAVEVCKWPESGVQWSGHGDRMPIPAIAAACGGFKVLAFDVSSI